MSKYFVVRLHIYREWHVPMARPSKLAYRHRPFKREEPCHLALVPCPPLARGELRGPCMRKIRKGLRFSRRRMSFGVIQSRIKRKLRF